MHELITNAEWPSVSGLVAAFLLTFTLLGTGAGYALERLLPNRRIFALPLDPGQTRTELIGNAVFLSVAITSLSAALTLRVVRFGEDTGARIALTFAALALGFQVFYYFFHRALHHPRLVRVHRWHHLSRVTTPLSGQSMSLIEALGWMLGYVALPALLSRVVPISLVGWAGYLAYNVFGNVAGHANVEPTPVMPGQRASSWVQNVFVYHALHHARWTGHYSFAAALMDRLCGTEWHDWPELHARVASGKALSSLRERGPDV